MSSKESCLDSDDAFVKRLPERSEAITTFVTKLDEKANKLKSPLGKGFKKEKKILDTPSERHLPHGFPKWAIQ